MKLTVVIPSHRRTDLLERTLCSLGQCCRPDEYAYCVVVENGGRFGAEAIVRRAAAWLDVRYVHSAPANKSLALNRVLEEIDDSLIVFLDDDVRLEPGLLTAYAAAAREYPQGFFYGGPLGVDYEKEPPEYLRRHLPASARGWSWEGSGRQIHEPIFLGANWAVPCQTLRDCGGFSAEFGPGGTSGARGQEREIQVRLLQRGLQGLYVPDAMLWHFVPAERCSRRWLYRRVYQNAISMPLETPDDAREPQLAGIPRWLYRKALEAWLGSLWAWVRRDPQAVFERRYEYWNARGWMYGHRYFRRKRGKTFAESLPQVPPRDTQGELPPSTP